MAHRLISLLKLICFMVAGILISSCGGGGDDDSGYSDPEYIWIISPESYSDTYYTDRPSTSMNGGSYVPSTAQCTSLFYGTTGSSYEVTWSNSANGTYGSATVTVHCLVIGSVGWDVANIPIEIGTNVITVRLVAPVDGVDDTDTLTIIRLPDTTPPEIVSTIPGYDATNQAVSGTISVRFNEEMDPATLNATTFLLKDQAQNNVSGTVSYSNYLYPTATFTPTNPLSYNTTYTATVTTGAKDYYGSNSLLAEYSWPFTTRINPDLSAPIILRTSPVQNSYCAGVNMPVSATFDESIDPSTVTNTSFYLLDALGNTVDASLLSEASVVSLQPITNLDYNSAYTATLTSEITDLAGNPMASDFILNFSTLMNEGTGNWASTTLDGAPVGLDTPAAIWTGDSVIIWGLEISYDWSFGVWNYISIARAYDPVTDSWSGLSDVNIPSPRLDASVIWTGSEMIVWGGYLFGNERGDGAAYNPVTDTWRTISNVGAPSARRFHNAVWTGNEMIVWGGSRGSTPLSDGARYNPTTDSWTPISAVNAPVNEEVYDSYSTMVWTGTEAILWSHYRPEQSSRYNPTSDTWTQVNTTNAPIYLVDHVALWTGTEMLIWGSPYNDSPAGSRYNPVIDSWTSMSDLCGLEPRANMKAIWTGSEMMVWGGTINNGGIYTPATDSWEMMNITNAPSQRRDQAMVWTGSEVMVWGGLNADNNRLNTGGRFFP